MQRIHAVRASIFAAALTFAVVLTGASAANAQTSGEATLPDGAFISQFDGEDIIHADRKLTVEELVAIGATQTPAEIEATIAASSPDQPGQVLLDFNTGTQAAAVIIPSEEPTFSTLAITNCTPNGSAKGISRHNVGGRELSYGYCGSGSWTGGRGGWTEYKNQTGLNHLVGPTSVTWQVCPPSSTCSVTGSANLGYVSFN